MGAAVQTVLGLSMTSTGISWVLLDRTGGGSTVLDHDHVDVACDPAPDAGHRAAVRGALAIADASGHVVKAVSISCTDDVAANASLLRKWLLDMGVDEVDTAPRTEVARRRRRFGPHLRAATIVVAGVIALFAVAPELGGQPEAASAQSEPVAATSVVSVTVPPLHVPTSSLKISPVPEALASSQPALTSASEWAGPVAAAAPPQGPAATKPVATNPVAATQDPMMDVLGSLVSALP